MQFPVHALSAIFVLLFLQAAAETYLDSNDIENAINSYLKKTNQESKKTMLPDRKELMGKLKAVDAATKGKLLGFQVAKKLKRPPSVDADIEDPSLDGKSKS